MNFDLAIKKAPGYPEAFCGPDGKPNPITTI